MLDTTVASARWRTTVAFVATLALSGCDRFALPGWFPGGGTRPVAQTDGVTQSTPLLVGTVVDLAGRPVVGARVRVFEGFQIRLDGVTQSTPIDGTTQTTPITATGSADLDGSTQTTPLDGVTQSTPLDGVTQSTPLDGTTQTTPFDGVTQTTPLQVVGASGPDGRFAVRVPPRAVLSVEASSGSGDKAAILNMAFDREAHQLDVGRLTLNKPGTITGKVIGPTDLDLAGTAVFVPGTDLVARADSTGAYEIRGIPARVVAVAAVRPKYRPALARHLTVRPGAVSAAPDLLLVPLKPRLDAVEPDNAGPGATVRLHGADFGFSALTPFRISFGGLPALEVERVSDSETRAIVPAGARSGRVAVESDGVPSEGLPFTVLASISITPEATRTMAGTAVQLAIQVLDDAGHIVASPGVTWSVEPAGLGTLSPERVFTPSRPGFGSVHVSSGRLVVATDLAFGEWRASTVLTPVDEGKPDVGALEGPAGEVRFYRPASIRALPDGTVVFREAASAGDGILPAIRALKDAEVRIWAGTGINGYDGTGVDRLVSRIRPLLLAVGPGTSLLYSDSQRIRATTGADTTIGKQTLGGGRTWDLAGTGEPGPAGYGLVGGDGPAHSTTVASPESIAWGPGGRIVFAEQASDLVPMPSRLREIDESGTVRTLIPGSALVAADPDGHIFDPGDFKAKILSLAVDEWGNVLMGTQAHVWMLCRRTGRYFGVDAQKGEVVAIAGSGGTLDFSGEEGPARSVNLSLVQDMQLLDDSLILVDLQHYRIRRLRQDGWLETIAGGARDSAGRKRDSTNTRGQGWQIGPEFRQQNGAALNALFEVPYSVAAGPDGSLWVADREGNRILRLSK